MKLNNKGFTLVELLMVVVILGMLMLLLVPMISNFIEKNYDNNINSLKESIQIAAINYAIDNKFTLFENCGVVENNNNNNCTTNINLETLVEYDYLSNPIKNPKTKEEINLENNVLIEYDIKSNSYSATLNFEIK